MSSLQKTGSAEIVPAISGTLHDSLNRLSYRRVRVEDQFDPVYQLRYEAYRREDFIPINSQRVARDAFDCSPNVYCFGVYFDNELVSSIRLHHVTPSTPDSPGRSVWPEVLDPVLAAGQSYIDPSRFTADHKASLALPALPFLTLRICAMATDYFNADHCLSAVRQEHAPFYRRVFRAERVGEARNFAELTFPMFLYMTDVHEVLGGLYRRYPIFQSTPEERAALFSEESYTTPVRPSSTFELKRRFEAATA